MLRFDSSNRRPVRNYLSRREQWRLITLVLPLGLVIILMRQLSAPENAERINQFFADSTPAQRVEKPVRVEVSQASDEAAEITPAANNRSLRTVERDRLNTIEDNTYFRQAEQDAWFHLLGILRAATADEVSAGAAAEVSYVQLLEQPHAYRGRLVTVRGKVREITEQKPAENDLGIAAYYRVVLQPAEGSQWPIFIYCLDAPADEQIGADATDMAVTGFFFKNLSYPWEDGLGIAPVVLAKEIRSGSATSSSERVNRRPTSDATQARGENGDAQSRGRRGPRLPFREVLELAGWDAKRLAAFADDETISDNERELALRLLRRVSRFDRGSVENWASSDVALDALRQDPAGRRGELARLSGTVRQVTRRALAADEARRLEMPEYFECEIELDGDAGDAIVLTARVPGAWLEMPALDEPASAVGVFLKRLSGEAGDNAFLFVASDVAWHPSEVSEPFVSLGESLLGAEGVDVGLLDGIKNHQPVLASEREAFYQLLSAAGKFAPHELSRSARRNLARYAQSWSSVLNTGEQTRQALAQEVVERAEEGAYSVAPLFNDADNQVGELFVFDGTARRVVRVEVGVSPHGDGPSDVVRRFGIDHYYELELFTDDSQNRPLVFCVRELPAGFPTGSDIRIPVRMAGFFFKSWRYHTGDAVGGDEAATAGVRGRSSISPLLIGSAPIRIAPEASSGQLAGVIGVVILATVVGIWGAVWWWGRGDRRFYERRLAPSFSLPAGENLNELADVSEDSDQRQT